MQARILACDRRQYGAATFSRALPTSVRAYTRSLLREPEQRVIKPADRKAESRRLIVSGATASTIPNLC